MVNQERKTALEQRVLRYVRRNRLVEAGQKVLVAVSGGPDSVCLLHVLYALQAELGISLHIAHLNHLLRGEDSEADALYVAELAQKLDFPATIEKRDVTAYQANTIFPRRKPPARYATPFWRKRPVKWGRRGWPPAIT